MGDVMSELRKLTIVLMVLILSSCMSHDHLATVKLSPNFVNSDIGNGKSIYLTVTDNEPSRMIGKKSNYVVRSKGGGGIGFNPADPGNIYSDVKIEQEINKTLRELFSNKGFEIIHIGNSKGGLKYAIGKYTCKRGYFRVWMRIKDFAGIPLVYEMNFIRE